MSKHQPASARSRFAEILALPDEKINLAEAALLIATEEYPRLNVAAYLDKLDRIADIARDRIALAVDVSDYISAMNATLFEDYGFQGNRDNYYDPRNSFLNEVIDRRIGIPITLSVLYIEVARRFSDDEQCAFVNAVLDRIAHAEREGEFADRRPDGDQAN